MSTVRKLLVALTPCAAVLMMLCWSCPEAADQKEYKVDIPRQALTPALVALWIQTGVEAGFLGDSPADDTILVGPVSGTLTADAALSQLLLPHDLTYEWVNERYISVAKQQPQSAASEQAGASLEAPTTTNAARWWSSDRAHNQDIEFVIVIGTRLSSLETEAQSVAVLNRQKIDSYGVSTLAELFEYLPQMPFDRTEDYRVSGEQFADLRGLGPRSTLILINGRRIGGSATSFDTGGFDVNTIPLTAVRRVEVLLGAPSVAISSEAIGGVVNVILKDEISQPTLAVSYGTADGGAEEKRLSLGIGSSSETFHGAATIDVFQREHLLGAERDLTRDQDFRRYGGPDTRSLTASPGNISSITSEALPGLTSAFAAVPTGSIGDNLTSDDFAATSGQVNRTSLARFRSIVPETSRVSLTASGQIDLLPDFSAFAELLGVQRRNELQIGPPTLNGVRVPASNAFNPFGIDVVVNTLLEGMDALTTTTDVELIRAVTGIQGTWNRWDGILSAVWTSENAQIRRENQLDPAQVMQALASSDPGTALNVFRNGPSANHALLSSLVAPPQVQEFSSKDVQGFARIQGPMFSLPAGEVRATIGSEWRREEASNPAMTSSPYRTVAAVFAEVQAPLVRPEMLIPAVEHISVSVGVRSDDYSDLGSNSASQYALSWRPFDGITLRASYSNGHSTPSLYDLYGSRGSLLFTLSDPQRGNEAAAVSVEYGGNADLTPSSARHWAIGLDLAPQALSELHISLAYWHATIVDRISLTPISVLLGHENSFPGRVVRAERTERDRDAGIAGALTSIDVSAGNFGRLEASGVDFQLGFEWDTVFGQFSHALSATWYETYRTTPAANLQVEERVGIASEFGTIPKWNAVAGIGWSRGPLAVLLSTQFVSAYDDASLGIRNGKTIPSQTFVDAQVKLQLEGFIAPKSIVDGLTLTAGIKDAFDTQTHFSGLAMSAPGYDPSQANLRQRFWYVQLEKKF